MTGEIHVGARPENPQRGDVWLDFDVQNAKVWDGTQWSLLVTTTHAMQCGALRIDGPGMYLIQEEP